MLQLNGSVGMYTLNGQTPAAVAPLAANAAPFALIEAVVSSDASGVVRSRRH